MTLPAFTWPPGGALDEAGLQRLVQELRRVFDGLTGARGALRGFGPELWSGRQLELHVTTPVTLPLRLALPASFPGRLERLDVLDAVQADGLHRTGVTLDWRAAGSAALDVVAIGGLGVGQPTTLRLFAWGSG